MITDMLMTAAVSYITLDANYIEQARTIHATMDACVDITQSEFIYDGQVLTPQDHTIYFEVTKEGATNFSYILKDQEGAILEEKTIPITLDSLAPEVEVSIDSYTLEDTIFVENTISLDISAVDDHLDRIDVFMDDQFVEVNDLSNVIVSKDVQTVRVQAYDEIGHCVSKEFMVQAVDKPKIDFSKPNQAYLLDPTIHLTTNVEDILCLTIYKDDKKYESIKWSKELDIELRETGDHEFMISYKEAPYIVWNLETLYHFTNEDLYITIQPSAIYSNQDIFVHMDWSKQYIEKAYLEIYNGHEWLSRDCIDEIVFGAIPGMEQHCIVRMVLTDKFGRSLEKQVEVVVDRKAPTLSLKTKDTVLNPNTINRISKEDVLQYEVSDGTFTYVLKKNGELLSNVSMNQAFQGLKESDVLEIECMAIDSLKNQTCVQYQIQCKPYELKSEVLTTEVYAPSFERPQLVEHEFVIKEDQITHKIVKKKYIDEVKPVIHFIKKNKHALRIVLLGNDTNRGDVFESILVDGNPVNLKKVKKDSQGNPYYEVQRLFGMHDVSVIAKDMSGNQTKVAKSIHFDSLNTLILLPISLILILSGAIWVVSKVRHGKNSVHS